MKKIAFIILILAQINAFAQNNKEIWLKNSTELRLNFDNCPLEIRFRPFEQMLMPTHYFGKHSLVRTDLMVGFSFWNMKLFSYTKYNEFHQLWTGFRFDFNIDFFNKQLSLNLQERYFWGLNSKSDDHYYLIQFLNYKLVKFLNIGILAFGTWDNPGLFKDGNWFVGPSVLIVFPFNLSIHIAPTKDVLHPNLNMIYLKTNYAIKFKHKNDVEIIEH